MAAIEGHRKTGLLRQRTGLAEAAAQRRGLWASEPTVTNRPPSSRNRRRMSSPHGSSASQAEVLISMVLPWATSQRKMASNTSGASS